MTSATTRPAWPRRVADRLRSDPTTWILAALCYVPALAANPGALPSDTKLYLYLNPGGLLRQATRAWDSTQYGGWVPHQTISYLWPSGPWYWINDRLGVPDWIAQRLWIATVLLCAGLGARWLAKLLGLHTSAATVVAMFYMLSPYVLPYVSRTSIMLLPYAGLCWLIGLTIQAATGSRWRAPAMFALVMATVSATNLTAIVMIAPGPVLWLIDAAWRRSITIRAAVTTTAKLGALSASVCLWWLTMLTIQSGHGADVLGFSETLQAVSLTSLSTETLRGLGYWLFYIRDLGGPATSAALDYLSSSKQLLISLVVLVGGYAGLTVARWTARRYAAMLVVVGTVLAVSVHPIDHPSPLTAPLASASRSALVLSMRSSTRALPLSVLGLALGWGALVTVLAAGWRSAGLHRRWRSIAVPLAAGVLAVANLPALFSGDLADPAISHDQDPPRGWGDAAAALSKTSPSARVVQLPGAPFGAHRWGYTVDPVLPGLTDKPFMVRDLLPLGSPGVMDLLYALDNRFQAEIAEPASIAPVARLLGADTIFSPTDVAFDRFRTPRPEISNQVLSTSGVGLGPTAPFGPLVPNVPTLPSIDETELSDPLVRAPLPSVTITPVDDPTGVLRAKVDEVVVVGSGDGLVDAAAAGLIDGTELVRYGYDYARPADRNAVDSGAVPSLVIVTDSNRDRAQQWRSSRDVNGFTEDGTVDGGVAVFDSADARLGIFPGQTADDQTVAIQRGGLVATASAYGEPYAYRPEDRAYMAVDGDDDTAWRVADRAPAQGQFITVTAPHAVDSLTVRQPNDVRTGRWITAVTISFDGGAPTLFELEETSKTGAGQTIDVPTPFTTATIAIYATSTDALPSQFGQSAVGFASISAASAGVSVPSAIEVVRPPVTLSDDDRTARSPKAFVFTRDRVSATDRWRSDPEPRLVRELRLDRPTRLATAVTVRLDRRATDRVIADLLGADVATADQRLTGVPRSGGHAAVDGDLTTAWVTSFGRFIGQQTSGTLTVPLDPATSLDHLTITQSTDARLARITAVSVTVGTASVTAEVAPPDESGASTIEFPPMRGSSLALGIQATDGRTTVDRRSAEPTALPVGITELSGPGIAPSRLPSTFDSGCRSDLLAIDGTSVGLAVRAATADLLAGLPVEAEPCGTELPTLVAGEHLITSTAGSSSGLHVDRVVLRTTETGRSRPPRPSVAHRDTHDGHVVTIDNCAEGCWLTNGEGYERGWAATVEGRSLGTAQQVDGGSSGWWLPAGPGTRTVSLTFRPQRTLDRALLLTLAAVAGCIALAVFGGRWGRSTYRIVEPSLVRTLPADSARTLAAVWVTGSALATLIISPKWGLISLVLSGTALWMTRRSRLLALLGLGGLGLISARMMWIVRSVRPPPDPTWTSNFERLHRPALLAVVLLIGSTLVGDQAPADDSPADLPS